MAKSKSNDGIAGEDSILTADQEEQIVQVVKKRGRPKGTGGNTRKDLSWSGNENLKPGDNTKFLSHALELASMPKVDLNSNEQVDERIAWYFRKCAENDMKPTVAGMALALGTTRSSLFEWETGQKRGSNFDRADSIKKAKEILAALWEDYMLNGKINPVTGIFIGKNHFGYRDQTDIVVAPSSPLGDAQDREQIAAKYQDALPSPDDEEGGEI